jgi:hypothetical protein
VCALPAVSAAQIEAEEPDQLNFSAVETLQNPADGRILVVLMACLNSSLSSSEGGSRTLFHLA